MENYIAAIDLGTTKVVTLIGRRSAEGRVHVLASSETPSHGIVRGEVLNIQQVVESIKSTVDDVRTKSGIDIQEVYVGIAGQHIRRIENRLDNMRKNEKEEISEREINDMQEQMYRTGIDPDEQILHVIPQDYNVDGYFIANPIGVLGQRLVGNYRIFVGKSKSAEYTSLCIERAGLTLKQHVLEPLASAKAVLSDDEMEMGVATVDIGGGTTDLAVYYDNIVRHTAVIPFGGNIISEDIRQGCGVKLSQANAMKEQYGSCFRDLADNAVLAIPGVNGQEREISLEYLAGIIEARMEEIIEAVMFEIERSDYADKLSAGIVFTGGGAMIQHLVDFVQNKTGCPARVAKPLNITDDSPREIRRCSYSTAVGLLLKGMEYEEKILVPVVVKEEDKDSIEEVVTVPSVPPEHGRGKKKRITIKWPGLFDEFFNDPRV
ncbi:MAG: cell division protein FtsA [Prevotellaceae bacterium]|jgi:cell division protein FtsA|nr:cell division protein FtsA [Prevotellaceae bacterium]